jgi:hypothetical protein
MRRFCAAALLETHPGSNLKKKKGFLIVRSTRNNKSPSEKTVLFIQL